MMQSGHPVIDQLIDNKIAHQYPAWVGVVVLIGFAAMLVWVFWTLREKKK